MNTSRIAKWSTRFANSSRSVALWVLALVVATPADAAASRLVFLSGTRFCTQSWRTPENSVGVIYNPSTGGLLLDTGNNTLTTLEIKSDTSLFRPEGVAPGLFQPPFDVATSSKLFKLATGGIGQTNLGNVLPADLTFQQVVADLQIDGSFFGGGNLLAKGGGGPYWVHHEHCLLGDFNDNFELDAEDVDIIAAGTVVNNVAFDMDGDGDADFQDQATWVHELRHSWFGDANLDHEFDSRDLLSVAQQGHYEDNVALNSGWADGDWDGNRDFNTADIVLAFQDGGYDQGPRTPAAIAVPELETGWLLALGWGIVIALDRRP